MILQILQDHRYAVFRELWRNLNSRMSSVGSGPGFNLRPWTRFCVRVYVMQAPKSCLHTYAKYPRSTLVPFVFWGLLIIEHQEKGCPYCYGVTGEPSTDEHLYLNPRMPELETALGPCVPHNPET